LKGFLPAPFVRQAKIWLLMHVEETPFNAMMPPNTTLNLANR